MTKDVSERGRDGALRMNISVDGERLSDSRGFRAVRGRGAKVLDEGNDREFENVRC